MRVDEYDLTDLVRRIRHPEQQLDGIIKALEGRRRLAVRAAKDALVDQGALTGDEDELPGLGRGFLRLCLAQPLGLVALPFGIRDTAVERRGFVGGVRFIFSRWRGQGISKRAAPRSER